MVADADGVEHFEPDLQALEVGFTVGAAMYQIADTDEVPARRPLDAWSAAGVICGGRCACRLQQAQQIGGVRVNIPNDKRFHRQKSIWSMPVSCSGTPLGSFGSPLALESTKLTRSTTTSVRYFFSLVFLSAQERVCSRPSTRIFDPLAKYWLMTSPVLSNALQVNHSVSWMRSPPSGFLRDRPTATENSVTGIPDGRYFISGSLPRLPIKISFWKPSAIVTPPPGTDSQLAACHCADPCPRCSSTCHPRQAARKCQRRVVR